MRWPWARREAREANGAYTNAILSLLQSGASGAIAAPGKTGAVEAVAGLLGRAFQSAELSGVPDHAAAALSPGCMGLIGRTLIRNGEILLAIDFRDGRTRLNPASSWDVNGGSDPETWTYQVTESAPSSTRTRYLPADSVVHVRLQIDPERPWRGVAPSVSASLAARLLAAVEAALGDEGAGARGTLISVPQAPDPDEDEDDDTLAVLRSQISKLQGGTLLVEDQSENFGRGPDKQTGGGGWSPVRLGAAPPAGLITLYEKASEAVLASHGVPSELFGSGDGASSRESWRQALHGLIAPAGKLLEDELRAKLDAAELRIGWSDLRASDIAGRARGFASMVKAGLPLQEAAALSGLLTEDAP